MSSVCQTKHSPGFTQSAAPRPLKIQAKCMAFSLSWSSSDRRKMRTARCLRSCVLKRRFGQSFICSPDTLWKGAVPKNSEMLSSRCFSRQQSLRQPKWISNPARLGSRCTSSSPTALVAPARGTPMSQNTNQHRRCRSLPLSHQPPRRLLTNPTSRKRTVQHFGSMSFRGFKRA